jgi:hypothetical protein
MTALGATGSDNGTAAAGAHANKEAVGALAPHDGRLVGALHGDSLGERENPELDRFTLSLSRINKDFRAFPATK